MAKETGLWYNFFRKDYKNEESYEKTILALCMVVAMLVCNASICFAEGPCPNPNSPDGYHHFTGKKIVSGTVNHSSHVVLIGYDQNNEPVFGTCYITQVIDYFVYVCVYCGLENPNGSGGQIEHPAQHSISHP